MNLQATIETAANVPRFLAVANEPAPEPAPESAPKQSGKHQTQLNLQTQKRLRDRDPVHKPGDLVVHTGKKQEQICMVYRCADGLFHLAYVIVPNPTGHWNPSSAHEEIAALCKVVPEAATSRELRELKPADLATTDLDPEDINPATAQKLAATLRDCENDAAGPKFHSKVRSIFVPYAKFMLQRGRDANEEEGEHLNDEDKHALRLLSFLQETQSKSSSDDKEVSDRACSEPEHEESAIDNAVATPVSESYFDEPAAVPQQPDKEPRSSSPNGESDASLQTGDPQSLDTTFIPSTLPSNTSALRLERVDVEELVVANHVPHLNFFEKTAPGESTVGALTSVEEGTAHNRGFDALWKELEYVESRYPAEETPLGRACLFRVDHRFNF